MPADSRYLPKTIRILMIEDDEVYRKMVEKYLCSPGRQDVVLRQCTRLRDGLAELARAPYDLILLDLSLPDSSGLDTLEKLIAAKRDIPVVVLTGLEDEAAGDSAVQIGAQDYLSKSHVTHETLQRVVRYALIRAQLIHEIERGQQMERMASLGRLAGGVAHEINNALAGIMGLVQVLKRDLLTESRAEVIDDILKETRRASIVVKDMLAYARPREPRLDEISLREVVEQVIRTVSHQLKPRRIQCRLIAPDDLPKMTTDEDQIKVILINLIANARDALPGGGVIDIEILRLNGNIRLRVSDTGPGIPPGDLGKIFDPFFTTKETGQGVGLGLAIVFRAVQSLGGEIHAENRPGGGAQFTLQLPVVAPAGARRGPNGAKAGDEARGMTILMVDDEPAILKAYQVILQRMDNRVTIAESAEEALKILKDASFDMVISDIAMPGIDGIEFHRMLVEQKRPEAARFVFMTGLIPTDYKTGMPVIEKPFDPHDLRRALAAVRASIGQQPERS